ncbi:MAG TPA: proteasome activator [Acidimicrobiales bacterium]|nr:proteasome activator [Acidimicrobiales bacterium]
MVPVPDVQMEEPCPELDRLVEQTTKVLRVGSAILGIDDELRRNLTGCGPVRRLAGMHRRLLVELASALSDEGQAELAAFARVLEVDCSSEQDVRVAFAQLAGWVRGLVGGAMWERRVVLAGPEAA